MGRRANGEGSVYKDSQGRWTAAASRTVRHSPWRVDTAVRHDILYEQGTVMSGAYASLTYRTQATAKQVTPLLATSPSPVMRAERD